MTLPKLNPLTLVAVTLAFAATLITLTFINRGQAGLGAADQTNQVAASHSTAQRIRVLQAAIRAHPERGTGYSLLAEAYLQRTRETGDAAYYAKADGILRRTLRRNPRDPAALTTFAALAASRHDFRSALRYARRAQRLAPLLVRPYGVVVDALVELGRYGSAGRALQRMLDLKPALPAYARASYFRELHGDLGGAVQAMKLAASAGGGAPENVAYVQALLGNLELAQGHRASARLAYRTALDSFHGYVPAEAGLARLEAAEGNLSAAIRRYRSVVARLPLPEYAIGLGEAELAAGRRGDARRDFGVVRAEERLLAASGVNTDAELALFEAEHGDPQRGLRLGRRAWRAAPSVRSADALGWALTRSGRPAEGLRFARSALQLGSKDPLFLYHAGMSALAAGRRAEGRALLTRSLSGNPRFSPLFGPRAERALRRSR
jgi:tetratricopeptide (TPR) repeat protein